MEGVLGAQAGALQARIVPQHLCMIAGTGGEPVGGDGWPPLRELYVQYVALPLVV